MRVSINLAKIVKLTIVVFYDVTSFTIFMIFWITIFVLLYMIAGVKLFDENDDGYVYSVLTLPVALWIQSFRNSLGDISEPTYEYWSNNPDAHVVASQIFSHWAWILFFIHEFFILICLFNFLVAIVSQSYDSIMDNQVRETTMSKIFLNNEAAIILDTLEFASTKELSQTFHLMVSMDDYETTGDEFLGFVGTMKAHMSKETKMVLKNQQLLDKKIEQVGTNLDTKLD